MKLIVQIASGIFLAGALSWLLWAGVVSAVISAAPHRTVDVNQIFDPQSAPTTMHRLEIPKPTTPTCVNFVQKANGEKHCLEDLPHGISKATSPL